MSDYVIVWILFAIMHALPIVIAYLLTRRIPEGL